MKISLTGTPGTGKTEVARLLVKRLGWKLIDLNALADMKNLYKGFDKKRGCKIVDIKCLSGEVEKTAGDAIIEGHFSHDIPCDFIIVLRCKPGELRKRLEKRGWSEAKIEENIEAEIMGICREEAAESGKEFMEIETTNKNTAETVEKIEKELQKYLNKA